MTTFQQSQQAYAQTVGTTPTGFAVLYNRDPSTIDINYSLGQFWINNSISSPKLWYLNQKATVAGVTTATWELISVASALVSLSDTANTVVFPSLPTATPPDNIQFVGGTGITVVATPASNLLTISNTGSGTETVTGDDGVIVSPTLGTILVTGAVVSSATNAKAVFTKNSGAANQEQIQVQVAAAIAATDVTKVGLAAFSNAQFAVDANGFVTLSGGGGAPTLGLTPDAHTGPGTTPVVPNGSGNIVLEGGATFATGTQANPIRTNSLAANTIDLQIQLAGSHAATSTANDFGVAQFDSNMFTVASGFVQLANGGTTGAVTNLIGDDSQSIVPSSGAITLDGVVVAYNTHAKPVFFVKNAASIEELDVQLATTSTSGAKNINKSGLCHFDSTDFTIDSATGFVSLTGGAAPALQTLTGDTGGAVSPTGSPENISFTGATTTYVTGTPGSHSLKTEVVSTANTFLYGQGATTASTTLGPLINGQFIIGSTGSAPVAATLTAGSGITIVNGAGTVTVSSSASGLTWSLKAANFVMASNNGYICISPGGALTAALPATSSLGDMIELILDGATSWQVTQAAGQQIRMATSQTTSGASGSLTSTAQGNSIRLVCEIANLRWVVYSSIGNITVV